MKLRAIKRRQSVRMLHWARLVARYRLDGGEFLDDEDWDDDGQEHHAMCEHCDGTGGDPWNDGITPCERCGGEGYEWWR